MRSYITVPNPGPVARKAPSETAVAYAGVDPAVPELSPRPRVCCQHGRHTEGPGSWRRMNTTMAAGGKCKGTDRKGLGCTCRKDSVCLSEAVSTFLGSPEFMTLCPSHLLRDLPVHSSVHSTLADRRAINRQKVGGGAKRAL